MHKLIILTILVLSFFGAQSFSGLYAENSQNTLLENEQIEEDDGDYDDDDEDVILLEEDVDEEPKN